MTAADLLNVSGSETWTAKFIDIEPTSVHVNFSVGSTNGIDSVPLEDVALTVGDVAITAKESANGFILGGTTYLDPTLSLQAAMSCKAPIGVTGSVSGYNVLGTFLTTDKLDVDNTEQLETGEFFVGLETHIDGVTLHPNATGARIFTSGLPSQSTLWTESDYLPLCIIPDTSGTGKGFVGWYTEPEGGTLVTYHDISSYTDLYAHYLDGVFTGLVNGLQRTGGAGVSTDKALTFMNVTFVPDDLMAEVIYSFPFNDEALTSCGPIPFGTPTIDDTTITVYPEIVASGSEWWNGYNGVKPTNTFDTLQSNSMYGIVYVRNA